MEAAPAEAVVTEQEVKTDIQASPEVPAEPIPVAATESKEKIVENKENVNKENIAEPNVTQPVAVDNQAPAVDRKETVADTKSNRLQHRKIIAEDPEWNLSPVAKLVDLCLSSIVKNFEKKHVLEGLPAHYRSRILQHIKVDLPLALTSVLIPDEEYWKRASYAKWNICNASKHGNSWKRLFFECYIKDLIENFIPVKSSIEDLLKEIAIAAPFIKSLEIDQLHPSYTEYLSPTDPKPDHLNIEIIVKALANLESLRLYYGVKNCGMDFSWNYMGMTLNDAKSVYNTIKSNNSLKSLSIQRSDIDNIKTKIIASGLLKNMNLRTLDFSHNKIECEGMKALAKYIEETPNLTHLNIGNNRLGKEGSFYLAQAITKPKALKSLRINLNPITDDGFEYILKALISNTTLTHLYASSIWITSKCVPEICEMMKKNTTLKEIDLSSNTFVESDGRLLLDAIRENIGLSKVDLRFTGLEASQLNSLHYILDSRSVLK